VFIPVAVILPSAGDESARLRLTAGVFTVLVVAPIIETLIFQKIMYALLTRSVYFQRRRWMLIFVSSLLFGAWHFDSVSHVLMATISGVVLMYVYVYYLPNYNRAFWSTVIIHFAHNMTTFLVMKYLL
jgi:membrane protease YdiL (CAAX protease family)